MALRLLEEPRSSWEGSYLGEGGGGWGRESGVKCKVHTFLHVQTSIDSDKLYYGTCV